ncbi:MAG: hypothetical protein O2854_09045, partial [Chloroflexi bacterium]|nr:hypothetical protein [Chloroflexota bacterium]
GGVNIERIIRQGGLFTRGLRGAVVGVTVEVPTEVGQQVIERFQAGRRIDSPEAIEEYIEVAAAAGLVGGSIRGATNIVGGDPVAREAKRQEELETERLAAIAAAAAPPAPAEAVRAVNEQITTASKRNGQGTNIWPDGEKYVGELKDGKMHGQGTYTWPDGEEYVGEWKDGKQHGQGTNIWPDGEKYVGELKDDKQHGQGTHTWPTGEEYVGEFKDGKQHGQGTLIWPDGEKYVGEYKDNKRHGQGTYTWPDGRVEEGSWANEGRLRAVPTLIVAAYSGTAEDEWL